MSRRERGYWKSWINVERDFTQIYQALGYFPTSSVLVENGFGNLVTGTKYFGGFTKVIQKLENILQIDSEDRLHQELKLKTQKNLRIEIEKIWKKYPEMQGKLPTLEWLDDHGFDKVNFAIRRYHNGPTNVRKELHLKKPKPNISKRNGKFEEWEDLVVEIERMHVEYPETKKTLPKASWLKRHNYGHLADSIYKYHNNFSQVRDKLGYKPLKKRRNYWEDKKNLDQEVRNAIKKIGHFPSSSEFKLINKNVISHYIRQHYGSVNKARIAFGFKPLEYRTTKLKHWSSLRKILEDIVSEKGTLPGSEILRRMGYGYLISIIHNHHGGMNAVRKKLNQEIEGTPYPTLDSVKKELRNIWEKFPKMKGTLPSDNWLREKGYSKLGYSICKNHKGFTEVRHKLQLTPKGKVHRVKRGYMSKWENFVTEIEKMHKEFPETKNTLPPMHWLNEHGYSHIYNATLSHYGGINKVRKKLGYKITRIEDGFWTDINNVLKKIEEIHKTTKEPYEAILNTSWLQGNHFGSLYNAINKHYGGLPKIREILGIEELKKPPRFWQDWDNYKTEFLKAIEQYEEVPSGSQMIKDGYNTLVVSSKYYGGINEVKRKLGLLEEDTSVEDLESLLNQYVGGDK